jgi:periplasmic protein TonB
MRTKAGKKLGVIPFEGNMAVKRGFGIENQSGEPKERTGPQNPKAGKPENVDALVSRFLAELSDLSSEMKGTGNPAGGSGSETKAESATLPPLSGLGEAGGAVPDTDLERISAEIEKSLAELETLRPAFSVPQENPLPDAEIKPEESPAVIVKDEIIVESVHAPSVVVHKEQIRKRREPFSNNAAKPKQASRLSVGWILAGIVLMAVLGVSAFYFLSLRGSAFKPVKEVSLAETKGPEPIPAQTKAAPVIEQKPTAVTDSKKGSKSADPVKTPAQETRNNKPAPKSAAPGKETSVSRTSGSGVPSENGRPTESANMRSTAQGVTASEESPKPTAAQVASAAPVPVQLPPPVSTTPEVPPQPKSSPAIPDRTADAPGISNAATPANAPAREVTPPAPKPAPSASNEVPETTAPPKTRTAVMAEAIKKVPPVYPGLARAQKISGKVEVEVEINDNGDVFRAKAVSGPNLLRAAAEEALRKWKFKPASVDGISVPSKARIAVNFNMQ